MKKRTIYNTGEDEESLKKEYNPEGSPLRNAQYRMLDMLLFLDKICKELKINYMLDGGNVLGAVRHGGFIPWDDDVDVLLPIEDYNKLCNYLKNYKHPQFILQSPESDPYHIRHWNTLTDLNSEFLQDADFDKLKKYRGLHIDLFPIETNVNKRLHEFIHKLNTFNILYIVCRSKSLSRVLFYINKNVFIKCIRCISKLVKWNNNYAYAYGVAWSSCSFEKDVLFPANYINFEGHDFPVPNKLNEFLTIEYGRNYMDLPPKDDRNPHNSAIYRVF